MKQNKFFFSSLCLFFPKMKYFDDRSNNVGYIDLSKGLSFEKYGRNINFLSQIMLMQIFLNFFCYRFIDSHVSSPCNFLFHYTHY